VRVLVRVPVRVLVRVPVHTPSGFARLAA